MAWQVLDGGERPAADKRWRVLDDQVSPLAAAGRGFADAVSFSLGDEIAGAGAGAVSALGGGDYSTAYKRQADQSRANLKEAERQQPLATLGGQFAGYVAPGFGIGGLVTRGAGLAGRVAAAGALGATAGAVSGAGVGVTPEERLSGAAWGGAGGAALGAGTVAAGRGITAGAAALRRRLGLPPATKGRMGVAEQALDDLERTARKNPALGVGSQDDLVRVMEDAAKRDPTLTTAEALGTAGQGRLAYLARAPGETGQRVEDHFSARARNQSNEIEDAMLGRAPAGGDALEQQLAEAWATRGRALYQPILEPPLSPQAMAIYRNRVAPRLDRNGERFSPALAEAWDRAGRLIQEEVSLGRLSANATDNLANRLHFTKIALDDMVRDPLSVPSGLRHVTNAQMSAIARNFADTLEPATGQAIIPGYRAARGELADIASAREAINAGRQAFTRQRFASEPALQRFLTSLTPGERPYFLAGVEEALGNAITAGGRDGRRNVANAVLGDRMQARIRSIYGPDADAMLARVREIGGKFEFGQRVRPTTGSITSNVMLQAGDPATVSQVPTTLSSMAIGAGKAAYNATAARVGERYRNLMGRVYLTPVGEYGRAHGGLLARARRESQRRANRTRLAHTRGAYLTGLGAAGLYPGELDD